MLITLGDAASALGLGTAIISAVVYSRKRKKKLKKLPDDIREWIQDLNINKKQGLVKAGALKADETLNLTKVREINRDIVVMGELQTQCPGAYKLLRKIKDAGEALGYWKD